MNTQENEMNRIHEADQVLDIPVVYLIVESVVDPISVPGRKTGYKKSRSGYKKKPKEAGSSCS